jgi:hypothetical protein
MVIDRLRRNFEGARVLGPVSVPADIMAKRRAIKQRAALRRAKLAERWIVFTAALLIAMIISPILAVVGTGFATRSLWRRWTQTRGWRSDGATNNDARLPNRLRRRDESSEPAAICIGTRDRACRCTYDANTAQSPAFFAA